MLLYTFKQCLSWLNNKKKERNVKKRQGHLKIIQRLIATIHNSWKKLIFAK